MPEWRDGGVGVDRELHAEAFGGCACIHPCCPFGADGKRGVLIAPVEDVVAEDVGVHAEHRHSGVLRGRGELTVLDGVAVIPSRVALECLFDRRDEDLSSLIAVAVAVDEPVNRTRPNARNSSFLRFTNIE